MALELCRRSRIAPLVLQPAFARSGPRHPKISGQQAQPVSYARPPPFCRHSQYQSLDDRRGTALHALSLLCHKCKKGRGARSQVWQGQVPGSQSNALARVLCSALLGLTLSAFIPSRSLSSTQLNSFAGRLFYLAKHNGISKQPRQADLHQWVSLYCKAFARLQSEWICFSAWTIVRSTQKAASAAATAQTAVVQQPGYMNPIVANTTQAAAESAQQAATTTAAVDSAATSLVASSSSKGITVPVVVGIVIAACVVVALFSVSCALSHFGTSLISNRRSLSCYVYERYGTAMSGKEQHRPSTLLRTLLSARHVDKH